MAADARARLEALYRGFDHADSASDPVHIVRRYTSREDREVVGFCAAALAFGRVASVLQSIESLLKVMGPTPAVFVRGFSLARDGDALEPLVHRWIRGRDLAALMLILQRMLREHGSIEAFFLAGDDPSAPDVGPALDSFSRRALETDLDAIYGRSERTGPTSPRRSAGTGPASPRRSAETGLASPTPPVRRAGPFGPATRGVSYFFSRPSTGGACKRLNLYLRWMARKDAVDLGVWTGLSPARLIVPLDTHVVRLGHCLRFTRYSSPGWKMAAEITASLRRLDPADPIRYDFSLCHVGMMGACGYGTKQRDTQCPLRGLCRPAARRSP